ncbi:MAG TPA: NAD-dependent deacylase [Thermoanaerobaculia bacterium]
MDDGIRELARRLRDRPRITVMTGAGVSAASGIPTFRGPGGLWRDFRPEQLATADAFARDPRRVWEWYAWRRELVARARPNRAHEVLAEWSDRFERFALVTQNVDGLHERAGTRNVVRYHGSLWELRCWEECAASPERWPDETVPFAELPPRCPHCGGIARPGVIWFGEAIPQAALRTADEAASCDLFLAVGTSAVVYPAAALAAEAASRGAFTVEINPEATPATAAVDLAIPGPAEQVLHSVEDLLREG